MRFEIVLNQVLILFLILLIGYVAAKAKILDSPTIRKLSEILLYVASPMLILNSFLFEFSMERLTNAGWVVLASGGFFLFSVGLSKLMFFKFNEKVNPVLRFTAIFSNCGYMGLPMMMALYGEDGVFYGSFYIIMFHITLWTLGVRIFGVGWRADRRVEEDSAQSIPDCGVCGHGHFCGTHPRTTGRGGCRVRGWQHDHAAVHAHHRRGLESGETGVLFSTTRRFIWLARSGWW